MREAKLQQAERERDEAKAKLQSADFPLTPTGSKLLTDTQARERTLREALKASVIQLREKARASIEEADRIRRTVKVVTGAEERCLVRAEVWTQCANDIDKALADGQGRG